VSLLAPGFIAQWPCAGQCAALWLLTALTHAHMPLLVMAAGCRKDKRLGEMGLKEVLADVDMYAAAHIAKPRAKPASDAKQAPGGGQDQAGDAADGGGDADVSGAAAKRVGRPLKGKAESAAKHTHRITTFFVPAAGAGS
jgi:hypothetical protein